MPTPAQRRSDIQLIVVTASLLVGTALVIGIGLLLATGGADSPECSLLRAGLADDLEAAITEEGPFLQTGGDNCAYWLDIDDTTGGLVAYRVEPRDRDCVVESSTNQALETTYTCGGEVVAQSDLDRYTTWHPLESGLPTLLVDLRSDPPCDAFDLGVTDALADRLADGGAVLIDSPDCGTFWLAPDQSGRPLAVVTVAASCAIERDTFGRLTCDGEEVGAAQVPAYPTSLGGTDGDRLVVDLTVRPA